MNVASSRQSAGFFSVVSTDLARYAAGEGRRVTKLLALRMIFLVPGFQFVLSRRIQDQLLCIPLIGRPLRRVWWWLTCRSFGSEIAISAKVGRGLYVPHPWGIVVGLCEIGDDVTILQNVTIGKKSLSEAGVPNIGDGVYLAAGAVIVGHVKIGDHSSVGANSVVLQDVPPNSVAVGVPARMIIPVATVRSQPLEQSATTGTGV
jgi:serine O-acetyltransferase